MKAMKMFQDLGFDCDISCEGRLYANNETFVNVSFETKTSISGFISYCVYEQKGWEKTKTVDIDINLNNAIQQQIIELETKEVEE